MYKSKSNTQLYCYDAIALCGLIALMYVTVAIMARRLLLKARDHWSEAHLQSNRAHVIGQILNHDLFHLSYI